MVIWLIGLSGSGKTTVGKEVFRIWKKKSPQTIFLDGDEVRDIFSNENYSRDYTLKGRRLNAERISRLCLWLDNYNINIVASVLSVFPDMQDWNRKNFKKPYHNHRTPYYPYARSWCIRHCSGNYYAYVLTC